MIEKETYIDLVNPTCRQAFSGLLSSRGGWIVFWLLMVLAQAGGQETGTRHQNQEVQATAAYYRVVRTVLEGSFKSEVADLEKRLSRSTVTPEAFRIEKGVLQQQFRIQESRLKDLSQALARTNFQEVDYAYETALQALEAGDLSGAIRVLETSGLERQSQAIRKEEEKLGRIRRNLGDREAALQRRKARKVEALWLQAQLYALQLKTDKSEVVYEQLLDLDGGSVAILHEAARFFADHRRYEKGFRLYRQILEHPDAQDRDKADAYLAVGELFRAVGNRKESVKAFRTALFNYRALYRESPGGILPRLALAAEQLAEEQLMAGRLDSAVIYYRQVEQVVKREALSNSGDPSAVASFGAAYSGLGRAYLKLGLTELALTYFRRRIDLGRRQCEIYPDEKTPRIKLAVSYDDLGTAFQAAGHLDSAEYCFHRQRELYESFGMRFGGNEKYQKGLALSLQRLGEIHLASEEADSARLFFDRQLSLARALYREAPLSIEFQQGVATALIKQGGWHLWQQEPDSALQYFQGGEQLLRELVDLGSAGHDFRYELATCVGSIGVCLLEQGNPGAAMPPIMEQLAILSALQSDFPAHPDYRHGMAMAHEKIGRSYQLQALPDSARSFFQRSYRIAGELAGTFPANWAYQRDLGKVHFRLGENFAGRGQLLDAGFHFRERVNIAERLCVAFPGHLGLAKELLASYRSLSQTFWKADFPDSAFAVAHRHRELSESLYDQYPDRPAIKAGLGRAFSDLGKYYLQSGIRDTALACFKREAWIFRELHDSHPGDAIFLLQYAESLVNVGETCLAVQELNQALDHYQAGRELMLVLIGEDPSRWEWQDQLAHVVEQIAVIHYALEDWERYAASVQEWVGMREKLFEANPADPDYKYTLALAYRELSALIFDNGEDGWAPFLSETERMLSELTEEWPDVPQYEKDLARVRASLSKAKDEPSDLPAALLLDPEVSTRSLALEGGEPQLESEVPEPQIVRVVSLDDGNQWHTRNLDVQVEGSHCPDVETGQCEPGMRLYTWEAAVEGCRQLGDGWRLPTDTEWRVLAGLYENIAELDAAGFLAEYGGIRTDGGRYYYQGTMGSYWTSTELGPDLAWCINFSERNGDLQRVTDAKNYARSVRCLKD